MSYSISPSKIVKIASAAIHQSNTGHAEPKSNFHHEIPLAPIFTVGRSSNVNRETRSLEGTVSLKPTPVTNSTWKNEKSPTATTATVTTAVLSSPLDENLHPTSSGPWTGLRVASALSPLPNTFSPQTTGSQSMALGIPSVQYALPTEHGSRPGRKPTTSTGLLQGTKPIILPSGALGRVQPVSSATHLNSENRASHVAESRVSVSPYQSSDKIDSTVSLALEGTRGPISSDLQPTDNPSVRYTSSTESLNDDTPTNPGLSETSIPTATANFLVDAGSGMTQKTGSATLKVVSGSVVAGLVTLGGLFLLLRCLIVRRQASAIHSQHASTPDRTSMIAREYRDLIGHHYSVGYKSYSQTVF